MILKETDPIHDDRISSSAAASSSTHPTRRNSGVIHTFFLTWWEPIKWKLSINNIPHVFISSEKI